MEGNIAATYSLIYRFLKQQSQKKAAEAVKKAAKPIVDLRDDTEQEGPPLEDIIKEWKTKSDTDPSSEDSDSSDSSSSDSEDSSSSSDSSSQEEDEDTSSSEGEDDDTSDNEESGDDSDDRAISKKSPKKPVERDTSVTLSSAGENAQEATNQVAQIPKKSTRDVDKATKDKSKSSESDSSDSENSDPESSSESSAADSSDAELSSSNSDSDDDEENANQQPTMTKTVKAKSQSTSESESSSESEDESSSESQQKEDTRTGEKRKNSGNEAVVTTAVANNTSESSSEDEDESDSESQQDEDTHAVKRRKISENETAVTIAVSTASQKKEKPPPKTKERFQRVKIQNVAPGLVLDNGYQARGGAVNDYGERAHRDLIVTRGAGFRKEKNKKKRGSYRGGEITMENHSIKFDF